MKTYFCLALISALAMSGFGQEHSAVEAKISSRLQQDYPQLFEMYKHLHTHPELSLHEEKTSERVAAELKLAGFEVTTNVGGYGVVGVLKNGAGPTVLVRTDLD